jgi:hypothetical protein
MALADKPALKGEFREKDHGKWFSYRETTDAWALSHGLKHEIDVLDGVRYGNVLKTACHIAIDQKVDGTPVLETWQIKSHNVFSGA